MVLIIKIAMVDLVAVNEDYIKLSGFEAWHIRRKVIGKTNVDEAKDVEVLGRCHRANSHAFIAMDFDKAKQHSSDEVRDGTRRQDLWQ